MTFNMANGSAYTSAPRGAAITGSRSLSGTTAMPTPTSGQIREVRAKLGGSKQSLSSGQMPKKSKG